MQRKLHQTIKHITDDFAGRWHFNTSISVLMELVNELYAYEDSRVQSMADEAPRRCRCWPTCNASWY